VRLLERQRARQLEVQGDRRPLVRLDRGDVVHLAHARHADRRCPHPVAQAGAAGRGFDVDDDVALGECPLDRSLYRVGRGVSLSDRRIR